MGYDKKHQIIIQYAESGILLSADERAGIDKLKDAIIKDRDIDCVICWELSRIARRADVIYHIRDFFLEHSVQWIVLNPYMKLLENDGKMSTTSSIMLALFTSLAESEMEIKKERFKRGKARAKALGKYIGGMVQFGYMIDRNGYLIVENGSANVVRTMFTMYASGRYSLLSLSAEMKELGYFDSFTTIPAIRTFLYKVLKQRNYYGDNNHPPIISEALFNEVQKKLKENIRIRPSTIKDMLCKQLLYDNNGYQMSAKNKEKSGVDNIYSSNVYSQYKCNIAQKTVDPFVWEISKALYKRYIMNETKLRKQLMDKIELLNKKRDVAKNKIESIQQMIDRTEERYIRGKISRNKVNSIVDNLKSEQKEWTNKMMLFVEQIKELSNLNTETVITNTLDFDRLSFDDKYDLVRSVIERVVISRPNRRSYKALAEVYPKVNDYVYKYSLQSPAGASKMKPRWKKVGERKRREGDIVDVTRRWNHIPINIPPFNDLNE